MKQIVVTYRWNTALDEGEFQAWLPDTAGQRSGITADQAVSYMRSALDEAGIEAAPGYRRIYPSLYENQFAAADFNDAYSLLEFMQEHNLAYDENFINDDSLISDLALIRTMWYAKLGIDRDFMIKRYDDDDEDAQ